VYNDTFLITFKSFTTVDELFDLLVERFNREQPAGLKPDERAQWIEKKQTPIRVRYAITNIIPYISFADAGVFNRVINILRSMLMESHVLEKEDMHILARIRQFAEKTQHIVPPAKQLVLLVDRAVSFPLLYLRTSDHRSHLFDV